MRARRSVRFTCSVASRVSFPLRPRFAISSASSTRRRSSSAPASSPTSLAASRSPRQGSDGVSAERAARASGFVRRASKLSGARFVQPLVFGWLAPPAARLSHRAQTAATLGAPVTPQARDARFGVAAAGYFIGKLVMRL